MDGGRIFLSASDDKILAFLREQLPQIRAGKLFCQLLGGDSIVVAYVQAEQGRVMALNLHPHIVQHEHIEGIPLQSPPG